MGWQKRHLKKELSAHLKGQEFSINIDTPLDIKIDNQQGPTIEHRELYIIFYNNLYGKNETEKEWTYEYV